MYDAMMAETIRFTGHSGDLIEGYLARPLGPGPYGSVVVIHHMPGYDAETKEITRTFAVHGYLALCPNLYYREAPGASPDDAAAAARAQGGVPDERLVGDVGGAAAYLRAMPDRKSTRLNSSHRQISHAVFCLKQKQPSLNRLDRTMQPSCEHSTKDSYLRAQAPCQLRQPSARNCA